LDDAREDGEGVEGGVLGRVGGRGVGVGVEADAVAGVGVDGPGGGVEVVRAGVPVGVEGEGLSVG